MPRGLWTTPGSWEYNRWAMPNADINSHPKKWTNEDIEHHVQTLAQQNNTQSLRYLCFLFQAIGRVDNSRVIVFTDALMNNHQRALVEECWSKEDYIWALWRWSCRSNDDTSDRPLRTEEQRVALLLGQTLVAHEQGIHEVLSADPDYWRNMGCSWVGSKDSKIRQTVCQMGWTPDMLLDRIVAFGDIPDEFCFNSFRYPYALLAVAHLMDRTRPPGKRLSGQGLDAKEREKAAKAMETIQCSATADPRDVVLATALVQRLRVLVAKDKRVLYPKKIRGAPRWCKAYTQRTEVVNCIGGSIRFVKPDGATRHGSAERYLSWGCPGVRVGASCVGAVRFGIDRVALIEWNDAIPQRQSDLYTCA